MAKNPDFEAVLSDMRALHEKKNHDYASDNNPFSNFEIGAKIAGLDPLKQFDALIGTKIARLQELRSTGKVPNNESIGDTEFDLMMYLALKFSYRKKIVRDLSEVPL